MLSGSLDVGISLNVVLCKTVCSRLGRSSLKVVKVTVLNLIIGKSLSHVVENVDCKLLSLGIGHIFTEPFSVEADLVHADKTDCREVVVECAEISLCVGIKSLVKELCDNGSLNLERTCGNIHKSVKTLIEVLFVLCKVSDTGHVDCNNADRACAFAASEETAGLLAKLTKVKTQTAAH